MHGLFPRELADQANIILQSARARGMKLATAESCTSGLVAAVLTETPGSSDTFTHGFITYTNEAKTGMLGVDASLIKEHGAVSEPVARAMAEGAVRKCDATISVSVTGIAGPGGATATKAVGLVHIASARAGFTTLHLKCNFAGDRSEVRLQSVQAALDLLQQQFCR